LYRSAGMIIENDGLTPLCQLLDSSNKVVCICRHLWHHYYISSQ